MAASGVPDVVTPSLMGDPLLQGLAWVVGVVSLVIAIGKPIRDYIRQERRASKEDVVGAARSAAEVVLYTHLSEQVKEYRMIADAAFRERNELIQRVAALEVRSSDLEVAKDLIDRLKVRLDEKDAQIQSFLTQASEERGQFMKILSEKDSEIQKREERISVLEGKTRDLELRLARDEARMDLPKCPLIDKPKFDEGALAG